MDKSKSLEDYSIEKMFLHVCQISGFPAYPN